MYKKILLLLILIVLFSALPYLSHAENVSQQFEPPFNIKDFRTLLGGIINWLIRLAIPVAVLMIVLSGVLYMAGGDKPDLIIKAKKMFLWAIGGLSVIFLSKGIEGLVKSILDLAK